MATITEASNIPLSGDMRVDALLHAYVPWDFTSDAAIHYTFNASAADADTDYANVQAYGAAAQDAVRLALSDAAEITGITFVETADAQLAELHFAAADVPASGLFTSDLGWQVDASGNVAGLDAEGYVFVHNTYSNIVPGQWSYELLLHELGHALGLKHPHDILLRLLPAEDNTDNTVMSYIGAGAVKTEFQAFDVAALDWIYGGDGLGGAGAFRDGAPIQVGTLADDTLVGGEGHDYLTDTAGNDTLIGGPGNDFLYGGAGADTLDGGEGDDRYGVSAGDVLVDASGVDWVFSDTSWTLGAGFENLLLYGLGWGSGESATGNELDNIIIGNELENRIAGRAGNDSLHGGPGVDRFVFAEAGSANADVIADFEFGFQDELAFDASFFTAIGTTSFSNGDARFLAAPGATSGQDASDRIVYDTSSGRVYYDADGSGSGASLLVVTLEDAPSLDGAQIEVINAQQGMDIFGTSGNDTINGTEGDDNIQAGAGTDAVFGNGGNDIVSGNADTDWIDGGAGQDSVRGGSGTDNFVFRHMGTANADFLPDYAANWDSIHLDAAVFTAIGAAGRFAAGDDRFHAAAGAVSGADAEDRIIFNTSTLQLFYDPDGSGTQAAQPIATLGSGRAVVASDINVFGEPPSGSTIVGTEDDDNLVGTPGDETIDGLAGDDFIDGVDGSDVLIGGPGNDTLRGGMEDPFASVAGDTFFGGDGNDVLNGQRSTTFDTDSSVDTMDGGLGDDYYIVDNAGDILTDAGGIDTVLAHNVDWTLGDGFENLDLFNGHEGLQRGIGNELDNVIEGDWNDYLEGRGGNDTLLGTGRESRLDGGAGDDLLVGQGMITFYLMVNGTAGSYGNDTVRPHSADNMLDFTSDPRSAIDVDMAAGIITGGGTGGSGSVTIDTSSSSFVGYIFIDATPFDDRMVGGDEADAFWGHGGNDLLIGDDGTFVGGVNDGLHGGDGNDTLVGGNGLDFLEGNAGNDVFWFTMTPQRGDADDVADFASGSDTLRLDGNVHANIGASGRFSAGDARFAVNSTGTAQDASDRVIYNTSSGDLFYDADGIGFAEAQLIANLRGAPEVAATDIEVVNGTPPQGQTFNGTSGPDTINGTEGNDTIYAGFGADTVFGHGGNDYVGGNGDNDWLDGGAGQDTLAGGSGRDNFVFRHMGSANADTLPDFATNWDSIHLDLAAFSGLGAAGRFASGDDRFHAAAGATGGADAEDRIVFNTTTLQLFYDADGSGAGAAELIATIGAGRTVVATDIWAFGGDGLA